MAAFDPPYQTVGYATPAARPGSRLGATVWLGLFGLALVVLGGCFLIGVQFVVAPQGFTGTAIQAPPITPKLVVLLGVLYIAALLCFSGAAVLLVVSVKGLLRIVRQ